MFGRIEKHQRLQNTNNTAQLFHADSTVTNDLLQDDVCSSPASLVPDENNPQQEQENVNGDKLYSVLANEITNVSGSQQLSLTIFVKCSRPCY